MQYEIWDMESDNLAESFDREEEALALVRDAVRTIGRAGATQLALVRENLAGHSETLYFGEALVRRAEASPGTTQPAAA